MSVSSCASDRRIPRRWNHLGKTTSDWKWSACTLLLERNPHVVCCGPGCRSRQQRREYAAILAEYPHDVATRRVCKLKHVCSSRWNSAWDFDSLAEGQNCPLVVLVRGCRTRQSDARGAHCKDSNKVSTEFLLWSPESERRMIRPLAQEDWPRRSGIPALDGASFARNQFVIDAQAARLFPGRARLPAGSYPQMAFMSVPPAVDSLADRAGHRGSLRPIADRLRPRSRSIA